MNSVVRLIVTVLLGMFGVHKFIDKKPIQGVVYLFTFGLFLFGWIIDIVSSIQFLIKVQIKKIEKTRMVLALIFASLLFLYSFSIIGSEDFSMDSFIIAFVSGIALIKIFVVDNKEHNLSYLSIDKTHFNKTHNTSTGNNSNQENTINKKENANSELERKIKIANKMLGDNSIKLSIVKDSNNDNNSKKNNSKYLTGSFYNENTIILDKYKDLKTPKYILVQINEQLHPQKNWYYEDDMIVLSDKYKDKYLDYADFFPFNSYWPQIRDLNEYQLKWYLYWRKEFLNNNILDTDISYIFLFAYELIDYTFNPNASFNVSALERLYNSYKDLYPKLIDYIPQWIDDMLSEVGYYSNLSDLDINKIEDDLLVDLLTTTNELDKININVWRKHYNERKSDLTNKQLNLIYSNQKYNNRFKKYAGLLAKYYSDNKIDLIQKWFEIKAVTEKRSLYNGVPYCFERMKGTFKYKKYSSSSSFEHDMNQITKLCYDLVYPSNDMNEIEYVISQYENGKYELPEDFFFMIFKKNDKSNNIKVEKTEPIKKKEFSIDISQIKEESSKINFIENTQEKLDFNKEEKDFIELFENKLLDKKVAQQYCIKKGKMLNAYINSLNEKYFSILQKELIVMNDDKLKLNIDKEENIND